jgi:hypothetical protein
MESRELLILADGSILQLFCEIASWKLPSYMKESQKGRTSRQGKRNPETKVSNWIEEAVFIRNLYWSYSQICKNITDPNTLLSIWIFHESLGSYHMSYFHFFHWAVTVDHQLFDLMREKRYPLRLTTDRAWGKSGKVVPDARASPVFHHIVGILIDMPVIFSELFERCQALSNPHRCRSLKLSVKGNIVNGHYRKSSESDSFCWILRSECREDFQPKGDPRFQL